MGRNWFTASSEAWLKQERKMSSSRFTSSPTSVWQLFTALLPILRFKTVNGHLSVDGRNLLILLLCISFMNVQKISNPLLPHRFLGCLTPTDLHPFRADTGRLPSFRFGRHDGGCAERLALPPLPVLGISLMLKRVDVGTVIQQISHHLDTGRIILSRSRHGICNALLSSSFAPFSSNNLTGPR